MDFKSSSCKLCGIDLNHLNELDKVLHVNDCLDSRLDPAFEELKETSDSESEKEPSESVQVSEHSLQDMPNYDAMNSETIKKEMDKYGMKKNLGMEVSRDILKQTWLYLHRGIFPSILQKYRN